MQICIYDKSYMYDMCIHVLITICDVYMYIYIYVVYILNVYTDLCIQNSLVCILFPEQTAYQFIRSGTVDDLKEKQNTSVLGW